MFDMSQSLHADSVDTHPINNQTITCLNRSMHKWRSHGCL